MDASLQDGTSTSIIIGPIGVLEANYQYNTPDEQEMDQNILRAETLALMTPQSATYMDAVYGSLKNIQSSCAMDFKSLCIVEQPTDSVDDANSFVPAMVAFSVMNSFLNFAFVDSSRRLTGDMKASLEANDGHKLVSSLKDSLLFNRVSQPSSLMNGKYVARPGKTHAQPLPPSGVRLGAQSKPSNIRLAVMKEDKLAATNMRRKLNRGDVDSGSESDEERNGKKDRHNGFVKPKPTPKQKPSPKPKMGGPLKPPPTYGAMPGSQGQQRGDPEGPDSVEDGPENQPDGPPCGTGVPEDNFFIGATGFGAEGDFCMMQNADKLSPECHDAIGALYEIRQDYWLETQTPLPPAHWHHRHHSVFFPIVLLLLAGLGLRKIIMVRSKCAERKQKITKIFDAIKANPQLKAAVEAEAGIEIPEIPICNGKACLRGVLCFLMNLVVAFGIAVSSLMIASHILSNMFHVNPESGDVEPPSVFVSLLVLASVTLTEIMTYRFILKGCRKMSHRSDSASASATLGHDSEGSSPSPSGWSSRGPFSFPTLNVSRMMVPFQSMNIFGRRRGGRGYDPLMNNDSDSTELMQMQMQPGAQTVLVQPGVHQQAQGQHTQYVYASAPLEGHNGMPYSTQAATIITANPMSTIRMI